MDTPIVNWIKKHQLLSYFILTYLIMYGVMFTAIALDPTREMKKWSLVWFFSIFSPSISALIVSWIIGGKTEVKHLLAGFTRWKVGFRWYFWAAFLFLGPLVIVFIYMAFGHPFPGLKPGVTYLSLAEIILFTFFSGPFAEEMGWRGFALPRLQAKYTALVSSLILGVIWTWWHVPFYFIAGESRLGIPLPIYMVLVVTIALYLTWLYNNTRGSFIITILGHFFYNLTAFLTGVLFLMPAMLFYMTAGPLLAIMVVGIILIFGPRYFSKKPVAELPFYPEKSA
jgi:membrane protease YdiL (CAAX protease family)